MAPRTKPAPTLSLSRADIKSLDFLDGMLAQLRADNPAHGNRTLHADVLVHALLLSFYCAAMRSLRDIEAFSSTADGQEQLGQKLPKSTVADAMDCFDVACLKPVIADLVERIPGVIGKDQTLRGITQQVLAVDGSYFTLMADAAWAINHKARNGKKRKAVRINVQLDCERGVPVGVTVSGSGETETDPCRGQAPS